MARPRPTWRAGDWSAGRFVAPLPDIRAQYSDRIAEIVEFWASVLEDRRELPRAQDVKHTLQTIAMRPESADLERVDGWTEARLVMHAWRQYSTIELRALAPAQLQACAEQALAKFEWRNGRVPTDDVAVLLIRGLLANAAALSTREQRHLIEECLRAAGLGYSDKTIQRLVRKARGVAF